MYYEIHGEGEPLTLLHGAFSAIGASFGNVLPGLAGSRRVIAFELQAHGRTADIDRPLSIESMSDDVAAAIEHLGIEEASAITGTFVNVTSGTCPSQVDRQIPHRGAGRPPTRVREDG